MKLVLFGITGVPLGKHNIRDSRLDQADKLVEAKKKVYAQANLVGSEDLADADAILASREAFPDLILRDLEFVETRLGRDPGETERGVLTRLQALLEREEGVRGAPMTDEERQIIAAYNFCTSRPIIVAAPEDLEAFEALLVRAVAQSGFVSFLTVGGKENRAWLIREGTTAWEAAGAVHTDIQRGFIRAEIISFQDFIEAGGETAAKRAGKQRLETKGYVMQDYDLTNFRFNK